MDEKEYIIENITKKEWEIFGIDLCPDYIFEMQHDAIISEEDKYSKAVELLRQK